eukprot:CAMPEP_0118656208 /NCGR_PEP_ID=MMETSP0785-20121206/13364_1 /TAXON_ID=91992 /ORGANISM="Bolidomonas pacifica, Strain CCMP 1866" /LENGTH=41 /DNA_ID= /DNA_START= /DNA_END= /DNA_ORIENTATION=
MPPSLFSKGGLGLELGCCQQCSDENEGEKGERDDDDGEEND